MTDERTPGAAARPDDGITPDERAWLEARLAALGVDHGGTLRRSLGDADAGEEGWIVLSTSGTSALPPLVGSEPSAPVFTAEVLRVGPRRMLEVRASAGETVRLVVGRLALETNAQLSLPPPGELHAARAVLGAGSTIELIGSDGMAGLSGPPGKPGYSSFDFERSREGGNGDGGVPGTEGAPGGGALYLGSVAGTVTVIAAGGDGAPGGDGGHGGDGYQGSGTGALRPGFGGDGGDGGPGGNGGPGGTVVLEVTLEPGGAVNLRGHTSSGAPGGRGGNPGLGGPDMQRNGKRARSGKRGDDGKAGAPGDYPVFSLRRRDA